MTVGSTTVVTPGANTNGATTTFSFSYRVQDYGAVEAEDQIRVKLVLISTGAETVLTRGSSAGQYSVSINADQDSSPGGSITTVTTYASGYKIYIELAPSFLQATDYVNQGGFLAQTVESQHDQQQMQINVLRDRIRRTPYVSPVSGVGFDGEVEGTLVAGYAPVLNSDLDGFVWGNPAAAGASAAMTPVVQAATLALGRTAFGVPGLGDSNTFSGALNTFKRIFISAADAVYNLSSNVLATLIYFSSGGTITVAANKQLDVLHWTDTVNPGAGGIVHFGNTNLTVSASADSTSNVRGWVANLINLGAASVKAMYGRAEAQGSSSGALAAHTGQIVPGASTSAAFGMQIAGDSTARKIDYAYQFQAVASSVSLDYGLFLADGVAVGQAGLQMYADGAGNLWRLKNATGSSDLAYCSATGGLVGTTGNFSGVLSALSGIELSHATANTLTGNGGDLYIEGNMLYRVGGTAYPFSSLSGSASVAQMGSTSYSVSGLVFVASAVNFNSANTDTTIPISLPTGFTRYLVSNVRISGASASLTTATFGLFTAVSAGGTAIISGGTVIAVSTASDGTNNNAQVNNATNTGTQAYSLSGYPNLYFRIGTPQGSAATANVEVVIIPLP